MKRRLILMLTLVILLLLYTGRKLGFSVSNAFIFSPVLFALMFVWQFIYRLRPQVYDKTWFKILAWVGAFSFGIWGVFMLLNVPFDIVTLFLSPILPDYGPEFRETLARSFLGAAFLIGIIGFLQAVSGPRLVPVEVKVANLGHQFGKLRIVQISDLHIGATIRRGYVQRVVDLVNSQNPHIIAITGDLADGTVDVLNGELAPLGKLKATHGVFFITGNHEYYSGVEPWLKKLTELKMIPLINENRVIPFGDNKVMVAGITDPAGRFFMADHAADINRAAQNSENCALKVLLAHQPNACIEASKVGFDLQLSGHTHAGQFFPFSLLVRFAHKYYKGLNLHENLWVYVNPGTGYWGPPLRFLVPSEITVLEVTGS